jgi:hypothetical protein
LAVRIEKVAGALILFAIAAFFAWAFYIRYWKWRDCIAQALSSCAVEEAANATDGGRIWGVFAVVFLALGLWALWSARRRA